jgi:hypothetical protein
VLRLLLDEHISPAVARELVARNPGLVAIAMRAWDGGSHLGDADPAILAAARAEGLTLVTYDQRTIVPLLKAWAEQGTEHGGVLLVDTRTLVPSDIGGLVRALEGLRGMHGQEDWRDRVAFLTS